MGIRKKHALLIAALLVMAAMIAGCSQTTTETPETEEAYVYQVSTLQALIEGGYEGAITAEELLTYGDTGLGTFDDLDGEMIVLDGVVYKAGYDGTVTTVADDETVPFANVAYITDADCESADFSGGYDGLKELLDTMYPDENLPVVFSISGEFTNIKYRSVPEQEEPYPVLTEVVKDQSVFTQESISGTIVGFRFPAYMGDINTAGYHLHFISDDKENAGHLLDVESGSIEISAQTLNGFNVYLPDTITGMDLTSTTEDDIGVVEGE